MSPQAIDVAYLYEKAPRELDVACIIKSILENNYGLRVEIFQQNYRPEVTATNFTPKVVVLPFCYQERSHSTFLLRWRKSIYFNLTWEQLFYSGNATAKTPRGEFAVKHCIHHAWGDNYAQFLRKLGTPEDHIFVNGNPAYMLYQEPYCRFFKSRDALARQHGLDPNKRWIFFPENYNWAFYTNATLDRFVKDGQNVGDVADLQKFCRESLAETMRWLQAALRQNNVEIIVRPRPSTSLTEFTQAVTDTLGTIPAGFLITQDDSVREWILNSDIVLSSYSTSIIEAALAGKPIYLLEPLPFPESLVSNWQALVPHIRLCNEFLSVVQMSELENTGISLCRWASTELLSHGDAIHNIAEILNQLCRGELSAPQSPSQKSVTYAGRYALPWWLVRTYRQLRLSYAASFPSKNIYPEYENDVRALESIPGKVKQWADVMNKTPAG